MGPQNALDSTGFMMISGDTEVINKVTPELEKMTGTLLNFGTDTNKAAGIKLIGNLFFFAMTAGIADVLSLAKSLGVSRDEVSQYFDTLKPGNMVPFVLKKITSNTFDKPTFELKMARKDADLMMKQAQQTNSNFMVIPEVAANMNRWIERGFGGNDFTIIAKDAE
jgi:3-hydroxyisobutyrate dehydrogenase